MGHLRPFLRLSAGLVLLVGVVGLGACDDDREPIVGPNVRLLDADDVFVIMQISAGILRFQNVVADTALRLLQVTSDTTVTVIGDTPAGTMIVQLTGDGIGGGPDTATVAFSNFRDTTSVATADFITGGLQYVFTETATGLTYQINPSDAGLAPFGMAQFAVEYSLSAENNSMVLLGSGVVNAELSGDYVRQTGSFRIEDRDQRALVVLELDIGYMYDAGALPSFSDWPSGELEFGGFVGGATLQPFGVALNGVGGAAFHYDEYTCETDMDRNLNPCEGL